SYGKTAIPPMVADLNKLGVPVTSVFDIDVLLSEDVMEKLCTVYGLEYPEIEPTLKELKKGLKVPPVGETFERIEAALAEIREEDGDDSRSAAIAAIKKMANNLGKSWVLKSSGMTAVPKGQIYA